MDLRSIPSPTASLDEARSGPAPVARASGADLPLRIRWTVPLVVAGLAAMAGSQAAVRIHRLRGQGAKVRALEHDVDLPGRSPPRRLVVVGDSAAAGHGLPAADASLARLVGRGLVAADGRATTVRCVAVDGATTAEVLTTQLAAASDAEVVLIGIGVNDAVRPARSIPAAATVLDELVRGVRARAAGDARIVLLSCPDLSVAPGLPWLLRPAVGRRCRALASAQERVAADLGVAVVRADRTVLSDDLFGPDGFHPGPVGHELLAQQVLQRLEAG